MNSLKLVDEILKKIPRPFYDEFWELYEQIDEMVQRAGIILVNSDLFDPTSGFMCFEKADKDKVLNLILSDSDVMIPFFMMVCGYTDRELERMGIKNVYNLRKASTSGVKPERLQAFAELVAASLNHALHIETLLYKFYKNWEEHQRRHFHGRKVEHHIAEELEKYGIPAGKVKIGEREVDCAIPPDPNRIKVAVQIRTGVRKDLVKRAKEFNSEFNEIKSARPNVKFVALYVSRDRDVSQKEIYDVIRKECQGEKAYDAVIVTHDVKEAVKRLIQLIKEWLKDDFQK